MALFRRTPKGKHALGAAVTSIPSGPLRVAAPLAVAVQAPPAPAVEAVAPAEPSVMSSIAELIASGDAWVSDLEDFHALHTPAPSDVPPPARAVPAPAVAAAPPAPAPVVPAAPSVPAVQTAPVSVPAAPVELPPVQVSMPQAQVPSPAHVPPPAEPMPPIQVQQAVAYEQVLPHPAPPSPPMIPAPVTSAPASARTSLEAALAELLPQQESLAGETYAPPSAPRVQLGFRDGTSASLDPDSEQALALELLAQSLTRRD